MHVLIWSTRRKLRPRLQRKDVERAVEVVRDRCEAKAAVEEAGRATRRGSEGGVTQAAAKEGRGAAQKEEEEEEEENQVVCLPPCALKNFEEVLLEADNKEVLVFLDYDGTLSPIVTDPNKAYISEETRKAVLEVSTRFRTSIISGRSVDKVKNFVGLPHLFYAGSHGMDIEGPDVGICGQTTAGTTNRVKHRPEGLDQNEAAGARDELSERTAGIEGVTVEDNKFCCSVHFRNCKDPTSVDRVERIVREVSDERGLDVKRGRKVFEVRPRVSSERERGPHSWPPFLYPPSLFL